ncbi:MAG: hypothetical protein HYZ14_02335 [Bacteroidetes bacterium]|nr:hypothetical protein [Bacteroidota bacterium]
MAGQQEIDISVVVFGTMGMLMLALSLVAFVVFYQRKRIKQQVISVQRENEYQRHLLNSIIEVREKEQKRIALELHDDIGSALNHIKMKLSRKEVDETTLTETRELLKEVVGQIRDISNDLLPPVLNELGLNGAIRNLCRRLSESTGIKIECNTNSGREEILPPDFKLAIYRITQELLNNILKHAKATEIAVTVEQTTFQYQLIIEDNGSGFVPPQQLNFQSKSLGLKNLASRVQQIDAELNYALRKQGGTRVILTKKTS